MKPDNRHSPFECTVSIPAEVILRDKKTVDGIVIAVFYLKAAFVLQTNEYLLLIARGGGTGPMKPDNRYSSLEYTVSIPAEVILEDKKQLMRIRIF